MARPLYCAQPAFRERHGLADGRVGGRLQEQELGRTQAQQVADLARAWRQIVLEAGGQGRVDLAQPAQDGRRQEPGEGPVARLQMAKSTC